MSLAVVEFVVEPISMFQTLLVHLPHFLSMPGEQGEVGGGEEKREGRKRRREEEKKRGEGIEMGFILLFT